MVSTFHGIEMGKRSLQTHTQALNVTGQNLNNLNTEGYSRQKVSLETFEPLYVPSLTRAETAGQIGQGVVTASVRRVRDELVDNRIIFENKDLGYHDMKNKYLHQVELVYAEPSLSNDPSLVNTLRTSFNEFMSSWENVANQPDQDAARIELREKANILTNSVQHHFTQLKDISDNINFEIEHKVKELNTISGKIASLNEQILKSEAAKDNPNDLYDKRDLLLDRLSKLADIQISREDPNELIVYIGGMELIQGGEFEKLKLVSDPENRGYYDINWANNEKVVLRGGELGGLVDARDQDLREEIKKVNSFGVNVADLVNSIHRDGFGANGATGNNFFVEHPFTTDVSGNFDSNRDGVDDATYIFRMSGSNQLDPKDKIGIQGTMNINGVDITYNATDTLQTVLNKINQSDAGVSAFLDPQSKLTIKGDYFMDQQSPDFVLRHIEDDGLFLTGYSGLLEQSGEAGAFDYATVGEVDKLTGNATWSIAPLTDPAAYMALEDNIQNDTGYIATAGGIDSDGDGVNDISNGIGDSSNALKIGSIKDGRVLVGMSLTFGEYFENLIADVGSRAVNAEKGFKNSELIVKNLEGLRDSISGVNIDEEFADLIKFQHGYNATARFVTEMDKMLETIIHKLGV